MALYENTYIWGITALGDLLFWEEEKSKKVDRAFLINIDNGTANAVTQISSLLNLFINQFVEEKDYFDAKPYLQMKDKLPKLAYGQCYGYVPALPLGGKQSNKNLKVVDAKAYINLIGEAVGKIYGLED